MASHFGYVGLFLLVAGQAAGLPLPAETALIVAAVLAARGKLSLAAVIVFASAGAIAGGVAGYEAGRRSRRLTLIGGRLFARPSRKLIERGDQFFARHGAKAVLLARWLSGIRIVSAPLAGMHRMRRPQFLLWNAAGGLAWPASIALVAYALGQRIAILVGAGALIAAIAALALSHRRRRRAGS
jgi:membrane-associated protein